MLKHLRTLPLAILLLLPSLAHAEVKLSAIFTDHMVLQRDQPLPVWGTADKNEKITVSLNNKSQSTTADDTGHWRLDLPAQPAGGPFELTAVASNTLTLKDVLLGDVWLCAGQSNMEMGLNRCADPKEEIAKANFPTIRLFLVDRTLLAAQPKPEVAGQWLPCSPKSVPMFSGICYYFGRNLQSHLNVPIGLIHACRGSTPITSWIGRPVLDTLPCAAPLLKRYDDIDAHLPQLREKWKTDLAAWNAAKAAGTPVAKLGPYPEEPGPEKDMYYPGAVFNGQIRPLMPFAIKGILFSHGEGDIGRNAEYAQYFPALINDWRKNWNQPELPFLYLQLSNFGEPKPEPADSTWAALRETQTLALKLPNTAMIVTYDIGEKGYFITHKQPFADRFTLAARAIAYKEKIEYSGPLFDKCTFDNNKATVTFTHTGAGLMIKGDKLTGFALAGADKKFVWAEATIEGDKVIVTSPKIPNPAFLRYAWSDTPEATLYNKESLPAAPFRTDNPYTK